MSRFLLKLKNTRSSLVQRIKRVLNFLPDMVKKFWGLLVQAKTNLRKIFLNPLYNNGLETFYTYENIPLKLYIEIINTGNYQLVSNGSRDIEKCFDAWENIVKENAKHSNSSEFDSRLHVIKTYARLLTDYITVVSNCNSLLFFVDIKMIEELKSLGYNINTSTSEAYTKSIEACIRKSANIISKMKMKENEMKSFVLIDKSNVSFSELVANLSFGLGSLNINIPIGQDITLSMYNEYKKLIKKRVETIKESRNGRN